MTTTPDTLAKLAADFVPRLMAVVKIYQEQDAHGVAVDAELFRAVSRLVAAQALPAAEPVAWDVDQTLSLAAAHSDDQTEAGIFLFELGGLHQVILDVIHKVGFEPLPAAELHSLDLDPLGIRARASGAITGALAFGAQGVNPPPEGHWLTPFWEMAKAERAQQAAQATAAPKLDTDTLRPLVARLALEIDPEAVLETFPEALAFQIDMDQPKGQSNAK